MAQAGIFDDILDDILDDMLDDMPSLSILDDPSLRCVAHYSHFICVAHYCHFMCVCLSTWSFQTFFSLLPAHWQEGMYTHTTYTHTHHSGTAHVYSCVHFLRDSLVASAHKMPCIHSHSGAMYTLTHTGGRALGTRAHLVTFALIQNFPLRCTGYGEKGGRC